jgi:hypothetical protein
VVQGEKRYELCRRVKGLVVREGLFVLLGVFLICLDVLTVEVFYHVDVEGYASSISMACPLRVLTKLVHVAARGSRIIPSAEPSHMFRHHNARTIPRPSAPSANVLYRRIGQLRH